MKKIFLCVLPLFTLHNIHATDSLPIKQDIDTFITTHIKPLSPDEIQFFANMVYLSYALAAIDSHVRDTADELLEYAWSARQATLQYADITTDLIQLQIMVESLDQNIQTQQNILKSWKLCTYLIDQLEQNDSLATAVELFRKNVEQIVQRWALTHKDEFDQLLKKIVNHCTM